MKRVSVSVPFSLGDQENLAEAAKWIQYGKLVAFPTETVYGLGANALDSQAVNCIFRAKGRPSDNPLIVHIADQEQLTPLVESIPALAQQLIATFWPGPLTLVFKKSELIPSEVSAGGPTVAIRMPSHPVALELIRRSSLPIAAPSANSSGKPSPTRAEHVAEDLKDNDIFLLDGGPTQVGVESTVLDISESVPILLRSGGVDVEEIEKIIGPVEKGDQLRKNNAPVRSPGMKYRHYAPQAKVRVVQTENLSTLLSQNANRKLALLTLESTGIDTIAGNLSVYVLPTVSAFAQQLFAIFRECDRNGVELILVEDLSRNGLGRAIMNRVERASQT